MGVLDRGYVAEIVYPGKHLCRILDMLDFSHLGAKGIDRLLAPMLQKRSSRCFYPLPTMVIRLSPLRPTFLRTPLPTELQVLF
jgi:hypothetical protein